MSTYSKVIASSSTSYSALATPDFDAPFQPSFIQVSNLSLGNIEISFDAGMSVAGTLPPSPHPGAHIGWRQTSPKVWMRNTVSGSTANACIMVDDGGY